MMSQFQVADSSWQYEKFSSAKEGILSESPPLSPTLYSQTNSSNSNIYKPTKLDCNNGIISAVRCNPGVITGNGAKTLLTAVSNPPVFGIPNITRNGPVGKAATVSSGYQNMMDDMTDLGTLTEDSFNLEGFEYLDDLTAYDSPQGGSSWSDEISINNESSISLSPTQIEIVPLEKSGVEIEPECKFQDMLENLGIQLGMQPENGSTVFTAGELEEFGVITVYESLENEMEIEDIDENVTSSNQNQQQTIVILSEDEDQEDEEEEEEDDFQSQLDSISEPSSVISISDSDDDTQMAVADALVRGDIKAAEALCPSSSLAVKQGKAYARILSSGSSSRSRQSLPASVVTAAALMMSKPAERRGRKPSTASTGKPWIHVKDKNLRKKEQNKTAATKYRQKKKTEQEQFLLQEKILTVENNELKKRNEELRKEINIIKGILRNLCNSKKQKQLKRIGKN